MRGLALLAFVMVAPLAAHAEDAAKAAPAEAKDAPAKVEPLKAEPAKVEPPKVDVAPAPAKVDAKPSPFDGPLAGDRKELELQKDDEELSLGWVLLRTMVVLGIVVALAYLTLNVGMRKLLGIRTTGGARGLVEVLERIPLDQKRVLFVIRAGEELLLVGGSDVSLNLITKLDSASVDKLKTENPPQSLQLSPFLQKLLGRKDAPPPPAA
jgi:flagellar biogenesis protein FliO